MMNDQLLQQLASKFNTTHEDELLSSVKDFIELYRKKKKDFFLLVNQLVTMQQEHRLNKNYEVSDKIRNILLEINIEIIYGTKQFGGYENIPKNLRNRQLDDMWRQK